MSPKSLFIFLTKQKATEKNQPQQSTNKILFIFIFLVKENPQPLIFIDMFYDCINFHELCNLLITDFVQIYRIFIL